MNLSNKQILSTYPFNKTSFDIFHSECIVDNNSTVFTRHVENLQWETTTIQANGNQIGYGEDPRAFNLLGMPACFAIRFNGMTGQFIPQVFFNNDGWNTIALSITDNLICGKNWMPFVYNEEVYFVHSVSPFRLLKMNGDTVSTVFEQSVESDRLAFDSYPTLRGGCNALQVDENTVLGFGHTTKSTSNTDIKTIVHRPYVWRLDMLNQKAEIQDIDYQWDNSYNIIDPAAFIIKDGKYYLMTCETNKVWGFDDQHGQQCLYEVKF